MSSQRLSINTGAAMPVSILDSLDGNVMTDESFFSFDRLLLPPGDGLLDDPLSSALTLGGAMERSITGILQLRWVDFCDLVVECLLKLPF
jgi:hypothetical protein